MQRQTTKETSQESLAWSVFAWVPRQVANGFSWLTTPSATTKTNEPPTNYYQRKLDTLILQDKTGISPKAQAVLEGIQKGSDKKEISTNAIKYAEALDVAILELSNNLDNEQFLNAHLRSVPLMILKKLFPNFSVDEQKQEATADAVLAQKIHPSVEVAREFINDSIGVLKDAQAALQSGMTGAQLKVTAIPERKESNSEDEIAILKDELKYYQAVVRAYRDNFYVLQSQLGNVVQPGNTKRIVAGLPETKTSNATRKPSLDGALEVVYTSAAQLPTQVLAAANATVKDSPQEPQPKPAARTRDPEPREPCVTGIGNFSFDDSRPDGSTPVLIVDSQNGGKPRSLSMSRSA